MRILHVCNWCSGITARNVAALKQHSQHQHELVTRLIHPYDMATEPVHLTEQDTTREMVLQLADEADALHFHAVGYDGSAGLPETIHGIDWSMFLGKKKFFFHGMVSDLLPDGRWEKRHGERFEVKHLGHYDALFGPHLSCKHTYEGRLYYVPDIIPIHDWLYTPAQIRPRQRVAVTFKDREIAWRCQREGLELLLLPTPTKLTHQLDYRRRVCRATFDNSTDGHWGLFGIESLAQGIPSIAYTAPENYGCWTTLTVPKPPFIECAYGGADVPELLRTIFDMPPLEWEALSEKCRRWVELYYSPRNLVRRWDAIYWAHQ